MSFCFIGRSLSPKNSLSLSQFEFRSPIQYFPSRETEGKAVQAHSTSQLQNPSISGFWNDFFDSYIYFDSRVSDEMAREEEIVMLDVTNAGLVVSDRIGREVASQLDLEEALEASRYASHPYTTHPREVISIFFFVALNSWGRLNSMNYLWHWVIRRFSGVEAI